ncbi:HNH endonuclease [Listeria booriae]|uniref:HNH endonuclease n=1 Tax=Listeria booriae TaxID=1552123 RepID=A0A7X0Z9K5_9LIST|nr:HNH endonuclease signature motif containing protein [Listeria booriae]MBC2178516.1 HNH endonuclease [Listeria booriae]
MKFLNSPDPWSEDFFNEMIKGRHNNEKNHFFIDRLTRVQKILNEAENDYLIKGKASILHEIKSSTNVTSIDEKTSEIIEVSGDEMGRVYTNFFVGKPNSDKLSRKIYDEIIANTEKCPYCSGRQVKTVDHYLPKVYFALYTVSVYNLVPSCSDCNKEKQDRYETEEERMLFHPYFDDLSNECWLDCYLEETIQDNDLSIIFVYSISKQMTNKMLQSRLTHHFNLFNLGELYTYLANNEFNNRKKQIIDEYDSISAGDTKKRIEFINTSLESCRETNPNSPETKMYEALAKSEWFFNEALPKLSEERRIMITSQKLETL